MPIVHVADGRYFEAEDGESLLDAALRNKFAVAYSCRTGRCGTCKGKIRSGEARLLHAESGLSDVELLGGWILTCVRTATSNVDIEVNELGEVQLFAARTLPCKINALQLLAPDVMRVELRLPPTAAFDFHPGQYIDVLAHGGLRRSYSIANAPRSGLVELHVRRVPRGAMSDFWFDVAKVNDLLRLNGPLGTFFLREIDGMDLVFLATGTGIAPVKAMLEGLAANPVGTPNSITVYWGNRHRSDLYWDGSTCGLGFHYLPVLSRADGSWKGKRGHVQGAMLEDNHDLASTRVYSCGSETMILSAKELLSRAGLPDRHFISDAFVCSSAA